MRCFRVRWTKCQVHRGTPRLEEHTPAACLQLDFSLGRCQSSISGPIITQAAVIHHLTCVLSGFQCWRVAWHTCDRKITLCSSPCSAVVIGEHMVPSNSSPYAPQTIHSQHGRLLSERSLHAFFGGVFTEISAVVDGHVSSANLSSSCRTCCAVRFNRTKAAICLRQMQAAASV